MIFLMAVQSMAASEASATELSRKWQRHFGDVGFNLTATITTFHLPDGTFRISGEFSNGDRILDRTFTTNVRVTTADDKQYNFEIHERVAATGGGGTEVRTKVGDFSVEGTIVNILAQVDPNITPRNTIPFYGLFETDPVNICENYTPNTSLNPAGQTATVTECDPKSGKISTTEVDLEETIPVCPNCGTQ